MLARIVLIVVCVSSLLIFVVHSEQSDDSDLDASDKTDSYDETDAYTIREQEHLKGELEKYLETKPREYEEQLTQAVELFANKQFEEADALLQSTRNQYPNEPDLLAHHAETIAMMNNGSFAGKPFELLSRSLDIDVRHKPSLWMMALVNQQAGNHEAAVILLKMLKREMSSDSKSIEIIDSTMAASQVVVDALAESAIANAPDAKAESTVANAPDNEAEGAAPALSGRPELQLYVTLAPKLLNTFQPDDTVYIYAQASGDSSMPLAVTRRKVSEFPVLVTLDDSMAMMPEQNLSSSTMVTVGARASRSGTAMPFPGDWEVKLYEVPVGTSEVIPLNIQYELR